MYGHSSITIRIPDELYSMLKSVVNEVNAERREGAKVQLTELIRSVLLRQEKAVLLEVAEGIRGHTRRAYELTDELENQLRSSIGKMPDVEVAQLTGLSQQQVQRYKVKHSLTGFGSGRRPRQADLPETTKAKLLANAGNAIDSEVALLCGVSSQDVFKFRKLNKIPAFVPKTNLSIHIANAGNASDIDVAYLTGVPVRAVKRYRKENNIPRFTRNN